MPSWERLMRDELREIKGALKKIHDALPTIWPDTVVGKGQMEFVEMVVDGKTAYFNPMAVTVVTRNPDGEGTRIYFGGGSADHVTVPLPTTEVVSLLTRAANSE